MKLKEAIKIAEQTISPRVVRNKTLDKNYLNTGKMAELTKKQIGRRKRIKHTNTGKLELTTQEKAHNRDD